MYHLTNDAAMVLWHRRTTPPAPPASVAAAAAAGASVGTGGARGGGRGGSSLDGLATVFADGLPAFPARLGPRGGARTNGQATNASAVAAAPGPGPGPGACGAPPATPLQPPPEQFVGWHGEPGLRPTLLTFGPGFSGALPWARRVFFDDAVAFPGWV